MLWFYGLRFCFHFRKLHFCCFFISFFGYFFISFCSFFVWHSLFVFNGSPCSAMIERSSFKMPPNYSFEWREFHFMFCFSLTVRYISFGSSSSIKVLYIALQNNKCQQRPFRSNLRWNRVSFRLFSRKLTWLLSNACWSSQTYDRKKNIHKIDHIMSDR